MWPCHVASAFEGPSPHTCKARGQVRDFHLSCKSCSPSSDPCSVIMCQRFRHHVTFQPACQLCKVIAQFTGWSRTQMLTERRVVPEHLLDLSQDDLHDKHPNIMLIHHLSQNHRRAGKLQRLTTVKLIYFSPAGAKSADLSLPTGQLCV